MCDIDDTVKCCPECERPNQFGELCNKCYREMQDEHTSNYSDYKPEGN